MALQYSITVNNARLDAVESTIGTSAVLNIYSGTAPTDCATAATGTKLASCSLPSDWMAAASAGVKAKSGTWQDTSADATGTAGYFRIYDSTETTCHIQGDVGTSGTVMTVDNTSFVLGQVFIVTTFSITAANA